MDNNFTCVNCGISVKELYRKYSPTVLKVMQCGKCNKAADKYIEFDPVIIIIDLVLLDKQAYRHVLYNTKFKTHWKLAIILLLIETYSEWIYTSPHLYYLPKNFSLHSSVSSNFHKEWRFYLICLQVIFSNIVFVGTIYFLTLICEPTKIRAWRLKKNEKKCLDFVLVWKSVTLSSFGRFLYLPALIWGDSNIAETHLIFVLGYTMLSQLLVYTVVCNCSRLRSSLIILTAYILKMYSNNIYYTGLNFVYDTIVNIM